MGLARGTQCIALQYRRIEICGFILSANFTFVLVLLVNQSIDGWTSSWKLVVGSGREG